MAAEGQHGGKAVPRMGQGMGGHSLGDSPGTGLEMGHCRGEGTATAHGLRDKLLETLSSPPHIPGGI